MVGDLTDAMQDYLKEIHKLQLEGGRATTSAIAGRMGVRPPSVTAMLKRLTAAGLAEHTPYRGVELTPTGERVALEVIRHHRLLEQYLTQALGLSLDEVHSEADRLEHALSEELEARIDQSLGFPTHDPHGDPIPDAKLRLDRAAANARQPRAGRRGDDQRVPDGDKDLAALPREARARPRQEGRSSPGRAVRRPAHGARRQGRARDLPRARCRHRRRLEAEPSVASLAKSRRTVLRN